MDILITGAAGFVGRNTILALRKEHNLVVAFRSGDDFSRWCRACDVPSPRQCDLSDPDSVAAAFAVDERFDAVVHLAANGDPAASVPHPAMDLRSGALSLVTLFERIHPGRLIYFSSGAVYEGHRGVVNPALPLSPTLPYAINKVACEAYTRALCERLRRIDEYVIVRFFGAFGPYEPARKIYTKLVRAFAFDRQTEFAVRGDGRNLIDAMYVADTVTAIRKLLTAPVAGQTVDLASGQPLAINELVQRAAACFGVASPRIVHEGVVPEYNQFRADTARTERMLGFRPETPLEAGLQRLAEHLRGQERADE